MSDVINFDRLWAYGAKGLEYPNDTETSIGFDFLGKEYPTTHLHDVMFQDLDKKSRYLWRQIHHACARFGVTIEATDDETYTNGLGEAINKALLNQVRSSEQNTGIIQLATTAIVQNGTEYNMAVSPAQLKTELDRRLREYTSRAEFITNWRTLKTIATSGQLEDGEGMLGFTRISNVPRWVRDSYDESNVLKLTSPYEMNQIVIGGSQFKLQLQGNTKFLINLNNGNIDLGTIDQTHVLNLGQVARDNNYYSLSNLPSLGTASSKNVEYFDIAGSATAAASDKVVRDGITIAGFVNGDKNNGAYFRSTDGTIIGITRNDQLDRYIKQASETFISRDGISIAGFIGGSEANSPYFRSLTGNVITLAKSLDLTNLKNSLGTASTKNIDYFDLAGSAATVYQSSVQRDYSYRAGFVGGNMLNPYIEHSYGGTNTIVPLARSEWVSEIQNSLKSSAYEPKESFDAAGSATAVKSYVDLNYAKRDYISRIGLYAGSSAYPFMLSENNEVIRIPTYSQAVPVTSGNRKSGKRVWSDGYVEQWGEFGYGDVSVVTKLTVTFPNAFTEVLSCVAVVDSAQDVYLTRIGLENTLCSFRLKEQDSNNVGGNIAWKATGWIK